MAKSKRLCKKEKKKENPPQTQKKTQTSKGGIRDNGLATQKNKRLAGASFRQLQNDAKM
jgi:hypothetical protein